MDQLSKSPNLEASAPAETIWLAGWKVEWMACAEALEHKAMPSRAYMLQEESVYFCFSFHVYALRLASFLQLLSSANIIGQSQNVT